MTLESIEKLRGLRDEAASKMVDNPKWVCRRAEEIADEIEREITERYMLLPLDADGVPVRVGEIVKSDMFGVIEVDGFVHGAVAFWSDDPQPARIATLPSNLCRHVKPRTVEYVLEELIDEYEAFAANRHDDDYLGERDALLAKYAAELRMVGDAE